MVWSLPLFHLITHSGQSARAFGFVFTFCFGHCILPRPGSSHFPRSEDKRYLWRLIWEVCAQVGPLQGKPERGSWGRCPDSHGLFDARTLEKQKLTPNFGLPTVCIFQTLLCWRLGFWLLCLFLFLFSWVFFFFLFGEIANDGLVTSRLILSTDGSQRLSPIFQHLAVREKLFSKESHFPWVSLCWSALFSLCQLCRQLLKSWKLSICECPTVQAPYLRRFRAAHPLTY